MKRAALALILLTGCAGSARLNGLPSDPKDVPTGRPRAVLQAPDITRGLPATLGFMLLGHPSRFKYNTYRARLLLLTPSNSDSVTMWISPQVSRYYAVTLNGLFTARLRSRFVYLHVEVCPLVGYNILGTPQVGPPLIQTAEPLAIRDTVAGVLRDQQGNRSSDFGPPGPVHAPRRRGVPTGGQ